MLIVDNLTSRKSKVVEESMIFSAFILNLDKIKLNSSDYVAIWFKFVINIFHFFYIHEKSCYTRSSVLLQEEIWLNWKCLIIIVHLMLHRNLFQLP